MAHAMADGIIAQAEETKLRKFRDRLALDSTNADPKAAAQLSRASRDQLMLEARLTTGAVEDPDTNLQELSKSLRQAELGPRPTPSSSGPGKPPQKEPYRTGYLPSTRKTP